MHCCQVFPFSITFGNLKNRLLDSLSTSRDKAEWQGQNCWQESVGKIDLKFSIFFVDLVRKLIINSIFGVNMIQTTKCSQEDTECGHLWQYSSLLFLKLFQYLESIALLIAVTIDSSAHATIPFCTDALSGEIIVRKYRVSRKYVQSKHRK